MEHAEEIGLTQQTKEKWIPQKERKWVFVAFSVSALVVLLGFWKMLNVPANVLHTRSFEFLFKNYGSNARIALFFVLSNYVLNLVLKKHLFDHWIVLKKWIISLNVVRRWHTPIAIIAIGLIILHVVGAFLYGFKFDFHNISGLLALIVLLPVPIAGLFRYRRMDRRWHLRFGIGFAVLFLIHAFI